MPPITDAMIHQFGPPLNSSLEQRVHYLETQVETTRRAVYGDPPNRVPSLADELDGIRARMEQLNRHAIYWRVVQGVGFWVLFGMLLGVLLQ